MTALVPVQAARLREIAGDAGASVLASLPQRLVASDDPSGVAIVDGRLPGWPDTARAAVLDGARGVLVVGVSPAGARELALLDEASRRRGVPIEVDLPYPNDPGWLGALERLRADSAAMALVDSVATVTPSGSTRSQPLVESLVQQLLMADGLCGPLTQVHRCARSPHGYVVAARAGHCVVTLGGVLDPVGEPSMQFDAVGADARWTVELSLLAPASATAVVRHGAPGSHADPGRYESGSRVTWMRLHDAVSGVGPHRPLAPLAAAVQAATAALS